MNIISIAIKRPMAVVAAVLTLAIIPLLLAVFLRNPTNNLEA